MCPGCGCSVLVLELVAPRRNLDEFVDLVIAPHRCASLRCTLYAVRGCAVWVSGRSFGRRSSWAHSKVHAGPRHVCVSQNNQFCTKYVQTLSNCKDFALQMEKLHGMF